MAERIWSPHELDNGWDELTARLEVELPTTLAHVVLPTDERDDPPWQLIVSVRGDAARVRQAVVLEPDDGGPLHAAVLTLRRREVFGTLHAEPVLVRAAAREPTTDYASEFGERLAWGPEHEIRVDPPPERLPGGALDGRWEDFEQSDNDWRRRHKDQLYALEIASEPRLYLNSGVARLRDHA